MLGFLSAESTGQYVYVLKASLSDMYPTSSTVLLDTLQVDDAGVQLVAVTSQSIPLNGTLVAVAASQHGFYLLLNQNENEPDPVAVLYAILFDPTTGQASAPQSLLGMSSNALGMKMDGLGKNLVVAAGETSGSLWFFQLSPADGTVVAYNSVALAFEEFATPIAFDPTSTFFYAQFTGTGVTETGMRIFDVATATEAPSSPVPPSVESDVGGQADPQGPFSYVAGTSSPYGIAVYGVDPATGYPLPPSGFSNPLFAGRYLLLGPATIDVNSQPVEVPAASLSASSINFGSVVVGQNSGTQNVTLTNTGGLALSLTSIQVSGTNATDFTESDTCMSSPQLQPSKSCVIAVSFAPSVAASESASVVITDNASGSPQQITLTGTGTNPTTPPPAPAVTLNPNPLSFPGTVTEGTVSAAQNLVLTNSGNATLHVSTMALGGINSGNFTIASNNCIGQFAASASCTVSLTFTPQGAGARSATLTITDDAATSPQTVNIAGTGGVAAQISAAPGTGATALSISAGQSAQFNLQITPGSGFGGALTLTCSGAPPYGTCSVPTSVTVASGAATNFTVTVTTTGSSAAVPWMPTTPLGGPLARRVPPGFVAVFLVLVVLAWSSERKKIRRWTCPMAATGILLAAGVCGCGGGSAAGSTPQTTPTQTATPTPSGVYTITVAPTVTSSSTAKQFQLNLITLTLTVN